MIIIISPVRADLRCRRCVDMIITMPVMLRMRHDDYHVSVIIIIIVIIIMIIIISPVRADLRCGRCVDMIIMMPAGDAEDAS